MKKILVLAIVAGVMWISSPEVCAVNYYVDGTGGDDGDPGTINEPWLTLSKANSTLHAGDTVYIRGGIYYSSEQIEPANSGTPGNYITYQNYNSETVTIAGGYDQAILSDRSYIKIDGLKFEAAGHHWIKMDSNAKHCIIQNCEFGSSATYTGINMKNRSDYNKILNNTFLDRCMPQDKIECWDSSYNLFEGNSFGQAGHIAINLQSRGTSEYNIVRNNIFENTLHSNLGVWRDANYTLVEGNIIKNAGDGCSLDSCPQNTCGSEPDQTSPRWKHAGIQLGSKYCIIRGNAMINNGRFIMDSYDETQGSVDNRIYNNTMYGNYFGLRTSVYAGLLAVHDNIIKNNIFSQSVDYEIYFVSVASPSDNYFIYNNIHGATIRYKGTIDNLSTVESNYPSEWSDNLAVDPMFANVANSDFTLQPTSPMVDAGAFLTIITSNTANNQTSFEVDDAGYFYDGWSIPGEIGDTIKTENGKITTIQNINYDTDTITVSPAINIVNGEGISLDYGGSAPDIGAYEYYSPGELADLNKDGKVNLEDFAILAVWWDDEGGCVEPGWCGGADFNMSGTVDFFDLAYFVENWLRQTE